jgi:hypothetical protein
LQKGLLSCFESCRFAFFGNPALIPLLGQFLDLRFINVLAALEGSGFICLENKLPHR